MNRLREYVGDDDDDGNDDEQRHVVLQPCTVCGRRFLPAVLERHAVTCQRNANKKNKLFDSARQRRAGTELAAYPPPSPPLPPPPPAVKKTTKAASKNPAQRPAAVRATMSDRIVKRETSAKQAVEIETNACPYCSRTFGAKSYDRHVEYCREKTQRIRTAPPVSLVALQRLEARTKYRPPPPPTVSKPTAATAAAVAANAASVKTTNRLKAQSYGRVSTTYLLQNPAAVKRTESERVASVPQNRPKIKSWVK